MSAWVYIVAAAYPASSRKFLEVHDLRRSLWRRGGAKRLIRHIQTTRAQRRVSNVQAPRRKRRVGQIQRS